MKQPVIELKKVTKRFPGVTALNSADLEIRPHEVIGLIGENGAGKSTLLKILSGVYQPDEGELVIHGKKTRLSSPRRAANVGIGMVHQEQSLIGTVTVAENILLGYEGSSVRGGVYNWADLNRRAQVFLDRIGSHISPTELTENLSLAQRQMVELAKALTAEERSNENAVIILDEPTSVLAGDELETLFAQIERLKQIASIVFVSHRLDEVLRVSDRVYVMKDGNIVAERDPDSVDVQELYQHMVGRETSGEFYREADQLPLTGSEEEVLRVENLTRRGVFNGVNLSLRAGEVLGLAGVEGSGREAVSRAIFGAEPFHHGRIELDGKSLSPRSPGAAVHKGVGYIPAERRVEGVAMGLSVEDNMVLADPDTISTRGIVVPKRRKQLVADWTKRLRIKTVSSRTDIAKLSGGNQQKVALAKWLSSPKLRVLILDHPTRGLDVGAKEDLYTFIRQSCAEGLAILLIADSLEETIALSHNIVVFRDGEIQQHFSAQPGAKPRQVQIVEAMV